MVSSGFTSGRAGEAPEKDVYRKRDSENRSEIGSEPADGILGTLIKEIYLDLVGFIDMAPRFGREIPRDPRED